MNEQTDSHDELRGLLIPTGAMDLLLPHTSLSEIIDYRNPTESTREDEPPWVLGSVMWRQRAMPVISIERMMNQPFDANAPKLRIAVCYGLGEQHKYPYLGLVAKGVPRMVRITESTISIADSLPVGPDWPVLARVNVLGREALVPDLARVEEMLTGAASD